MRLIRVLLVVLAAWAFGAQAATCYWVGADASWNTAGNWSSSSGGSGSTCDGGTVPSSDDDVIFDGSDVTSCTVDATVAVASLDIQSGYSGNLDFDSYASTVAGDVIMDGSGAVLLGTNTHTWSGDLDFADQGVLVDQSSTVVLGGTSKIIRTNADYLYDVTIDGSYTTATGGDVLVADDLLINVGASLTIDDERVVVNTGTLVNNGTIYFAINTANDVLMSNSTLTPGTIIDNGALSSAEIYFRSGGAAYSGTYPLPVVVRVTASATFTVGGDLVVQDHLTITAESGTTLTVDNSGNYDLDIGGDVVWNETGTITWTKGTGTIELSGTSAQDIDFGGKTVEDIEVNKASNTATLSANVTTDSLTVTSGTLDIDGQTLTSSGNVTVAAGTTIQDTAATGALSISGNIDINGTGVSGVTWTDVDISALASGTNDADYATVSNSNNSSGNVIDCTTGCTDGGGNTGWTFTAGGGYGLPLIWSF